MRCELCMCELDDETMVSQGEFFVCEKCDDVSAAMEALGQQTITLDEVRAEIETKH